MVFEFLFLASLRKLGSLLWQATSVFLNASYSYDLIALIIELGMNVPYLYQVTNNLIILLCSTILHNIF